MKRLSKIKNLSMKNFVLIFISLYFIIISCTTVFFTTDPNYLTNSDNKPIKIIALVEIQIVNNQKDYILIEKPESKSRISYHLINLKGNQIEELEKLNKKMVEANIKVIKELSPYNKKAELLAIKLKK